MEVKPGIYEANLLDYGFKATQSGDPQIFLKLAVDTQDGELVDMFKYLSLKEGKAREFCYKALSACGFNGDQEALKLGPTGNALDMATAVSVKVQDETYQGKTESRIAFVNKKGAFVERITPEDVDAKVKFNFASEMAAMGIELGKGQPSNGSEKKPSEIPF